MKSKILITGPPRCGKSTLISKLIDYYCKRNFIIHGFLTPEVKKDTTRMGFDVEDIFSGEKARLARVGNYPTKFKLGKYKVFIEEFENIISKLANINNLKVDLICIDEIGKMELFSVKFQEWLKYLFSSNISIIATIGLKLTHPIKDFILNLPNLMLFNLTRKNFDEIFEEIISIIS